jgi:WhiB family redox-sensing transcriptional regulator
MTERERRTLLRRHPHVANRRKMFEAALKDRGADKVLVRAHRKS